jgi:prepilin-type processing-associated H-X9-DG protein
MNTTLLRWRSYNMSLCVNGAPELDPEGWHSPSYKKLTSIANPGPSALWVFIDTHEDEIYDATFGMPNLQYNGDVQQWWDIPANRHSQAANLSFADGHAEHWKWKVPKIVTPGGALGSQPVAPGELPDYRRVQAGYRQQWN